MEIVTFDPSQALLDRDDIARLMKVSPRTVQNPDFLRRVGIETIKIGGLTRFDPAQIAQAIAANRQKVAK